MPKKTFSMSQDVLTKLMDFKRMLNNHHGQVVSWDYAFKELLKNSSSTNSSSNLSSIGNSPNLKIKSPTSPIKSPSIKEPPLPKMPSLNKDISKNNISINIKNKIKKNKINLSDNLNIPDPPKKKPIKLEGYDEEIAKLAKQETKDLKYILIECQICGMPPIVMPVPKHLVLDADVPVVDVAYLHGNNDNRHAIVAQLDHDFQVRRRRACYFVDQNDFPELKEKK